MAESHDISIKVTSQKGTCVVGHKSGDCFVIGAKTPAGICVEAFQTILPYAQTLRYGGVHPWESDPDAVAAACPDAQNPVVFELRRIKN